MVELIGLLVGWWLPALLFYGFVVHALWRRGWLVLPVWLAAFGFMLWTVQYDVRVRKPEFEARAAAFNDLVTFAPPPAEVRRILVEKNDERLPRDRKIRFSRHPAGLTGYEQHCAAFCVQMLFSGRFDEYIVLYRMDSGLRRDPPPERLWDQRDHYRTYRMITETGCRSFFEFRPPYLDEYLKAWQNAGRCITETKTPTIAGARFDVLTLPIDETGLPPNVPDHRPWQERVTHIRLVGTDRDRNIARAEYGSAAFFYEFPVPGMFPTKGMTEFYVGLLRHEEQSYGPKLLTTEVVAKLFNVNGNTDVDKLPKPPR